MMPASQVATVEEATPIIVVGGGAQAQPHQHQHQHQQGQQVQHKRSFHAGFSIGHGAGGDAPKKDDAVPEHSVRIQSEDSWSDMEDFEGSKRGSKTRCGRACARVYAFVKYRRFKVALGILGILCILAGVLSFYLESLETQSKFFYRALYFVAAALISGILADGLVLLIQGILDFSIAKASSADRDLEYKFTWITYYFSMVRSTISRLLWTILVIIAFAVIVPRTEDNSISPSWAMAYYHLSRLLGILALVIATRIVSKVLRQWLAQDFGARSFRPRIRESFAHEHFIAALRGGEGTAVFKTLFNNSRNMTMDGGVNPEIWQTLMQYVICHHVDGSEPPSGKLTARKHAKSTGLAKRSRPVAIQIFARILAKLEELGQIRQAAERKAQDAAGGEVATESSAAAAAPAAAAPAAAAAAPEDAPREVQQWNTHDPAMDSANASSRSTLSEGNARATDENADDDDDDAAEEDADEDEDEDNIVAAASHSSRHLAPKSEEISGGGNVEEAKDDFQESEAVPPTQDAAETADAGVTTPLARNNSSTRRRWQRVNLARQNGTLRLSGNSADSRAKDTVAMSDAELAEDTFRLTKIVRKLAKDQNKLDRDSSRPSLATQSMVSSISSTRVNSRIILEEDFVEAFSRKDPDVAWDKLWKKYLDPENTGFITWQRFRKRLLDIFEFRLNLALTILDAQAVIKSMDGLIMSGLIVIVLIIGLTMYSSDFVSLLASLGTVIVGYSFIFGSSVQECFDNVVFLFGMHPYDVGDVVLIDDRRFKVGRIRLLTTDFVRNDGSFIRRSNRTLRDQALINLSTSEKHCQDFSTLLPLVDVTDLFMQSLQADINKFVAQHLDMFASISCFVVELLHPLDASGELSARGTHPTHARVRFWVSFAFTFEEISRITAARTTFLLFIGDALRQRGVAKAIIADSPHLATGSLTDSDAGDLDASSSSKLAPGQ